MEQDAESLDWRVDGKHAGTWVTARNLTYVKVADASHMVRSASLLVGPVLTSLQVPYDQPLAAHDMLLRFLGVDLLGAAGPAAQVPSRVGNEQEAVLGETHPNGTAVGPDTILLPSDALDHDSAVEALVNAGSAIVIIALLLLGFAIFYVVRRRIRRGNKGPILGHARGTSLGRGQARREEEDGPHELDELVVGGDYGAENFEEDREGNGRRGVGEDEVFGLGSDEDEEDGRLRRGGQV